MSLSPRHHYWSAVIAQFHRSGLTQADFCRTRHLSINSFRQWLYRLRHSMPAADQRRLASRSPRNRRRLDPRTPPSFPFTSDPSTPLPLTVARWVVAPGSLEVYPDPRPACSDSCRF